VLTGVADQLGFDAELLHNLRAVVSEACNNVVLHAYDGEPGPLAVGLEIAPEGAPDEVEAIVRDWGGGIRYLAPSEDHMHVGLAVISALADRAQFLSAPDRGTEVRMAFTGRSGIRTLAPSVAADTVEPMPVELSGDAVATISPVGLLRGVLGRIATALAAHVHFSLDRFSDLVLVADTVATYAERAASSDRLSVAIAGRSRRVELTLGPLRPGSGARLKPDDAPVGNGSTLSLLGAELSVQTLADAELWRVVVVDRVADA
jgi:serine/threonine-protein kinase RsbW